MAPTGQEESRKDAAQRSEAPSAEAFPWERLPGESAEAYRAFSLYRLQDPKTRSFRNLRSICSGTLAVRWAKRWRWVSRTAEWEAFIVLNQADLNETGRLRLRSSSLDYAHLALNQAKRSVTKLNETKLSVEDVNSLASEAVRIGRVALDLPPDGPVRQLTSESTGLSVSFGSAVPWLAAFAPAKQNETKPNEVVQSGEQVLDETPPGVVRKRLVNSVRDSKPDDLQAEPAKSHLAKQGEISPKEAALEVAPPNKEHPYRRCKKHGNSCRRGGHN